jgi:protein-tyrosine kinase
MSNIFGVVNKYALIDFGPIAEAGCDTGTPSPVEKTGNALVAEAKHSGVTVVQSSAQPPIFPFDAEYQEAAEQYRMIRTKLLHHPRKPRVIVMSSATSGDGKTVTSVNIAASLALKENSRVLLIDGDLRQPRVSEVLGIPDQPGLADVLSGAASFDSALVRIAQFPNLYVLPAGGARHAAAELLDSQAWRSLVERIRAEFTTGIVDAPPVALVADYELIQLVSDATILVVRPDHSDRSACLKALELIPKEKLIGIVLNCVENWWLWKAPGSTYYRQYYAQGQGKP